MRLLLLCFLTIMMLISAQGEDEEQLEQLMESVGLQEEEEYLQCFRCDLGFWDACYTTETNCSAGELCFTGRGKAEECNVETTVELFSNNTVFVMTKHCCDTPFCNAAHQLPVHTLLYLTVAFLTGCNLTGVSTGS